MEENALIFIFYGHKVLRSYDMKILFQKIYENYYNIIKNNLNKFYKLYYIIIILINTGEVIV